MSSTSNGKQPLVPPLPKPATGSANPAATLSSLWAYLLPALNHIVKSPTNNLAKAPAIDVEFYTGIHSACYDYISSTTPHREREQSDNILGSDLYAQLDRYFADTVQEQLLGAPHDDSELIHYILPCFSRYSTGARSVNRLLNYMNRYFVRRAVEEDKGWISIPDVLQEPANAAELDSRQLLSTKYREKRIHELRKWGYTDDGSVHVAAQAEASAEAASDVTRIVPLLSLAHRRFRVDFIEPLLTVPKLSGKQVKNKIPNTTQGPKGRLARAVKHLLESGEVEDEERDRMAAELAVILRTVGIRADHPLRKKLDKYVPSPPPPTEEG